MLNVAAQLMIENAGNADERKTLTQQLTGPMRTMGSFAEDPDARNAPVWWHGEEEAYESTMSAIGRLGPRRRRRRR